MEAGGHSMPSGSASRAYRCHRERADGTLRVPKHRYTWPMEIRGRGGVRLHELWDGGENPRAYLGITVPRFPNLFCLCGPNTNPVVGSVIFMLECQVRYILGCLREMLERGHRTLECR
jgi:4-hydroxyacetophenone monooxygenase